MPADRSYSFGFFPALELMSIIFAGGVQTGNAEQQSRPAGAPDGPSAALNVARRPGFGRMDAAERHNRRRDAASVPVRQADERSEGIAQRATRGPARPGHQPVSADTSGPDTNNNPTQGCGVCVGPTGRRTK